MSPFVSECDLLIVSLSRVVRKPVNANPGLKVNQGNNFSCIKVFSIACVLCKDKKIKKLKSYKNKIKILANPGLA